MQRDRTNIPALWAMVAFFVIMAVGQGSHDTWSKVAMAWLLLGTWGTYGVVRLVCDLMDDDGYDD